MTVLINNGPDIPDNLLHAHEEGRVVFFCGAGISVPAGLPSFTKLVKQIFKAVGETCPKLKSQPLDRILHSLEGNSISGRPHVRRKLAEILTPNYNKKDATIMHKALIKLATTKDNKLRLVTTNYDIIFEYELKKQSIKTNKYSAPLLPTPKDSRWDGIVYLHGLLPTNPKDTDLENLILSSGDFGVAYLTERWASRFVSELFRNYIVCFVGYSVNDPILRYMVDALAADELRGEKQTEVYAFSSFNTKKEKTKDDIKKSWEEKHITPILYDNNNNHSLLYNTFKKWSEIYSNGLDGKKAIVVEHAQIPPSTWSKADYAVDLMLWALRDERAAKYFAEMKPTPPFKWFEAFKALQFDYKDLPTFGVTLSEKEKEQENKQKTLKFSFLNRPAPSLLAPYMSITQRTCSRNNFDGIMEHLAKWLFKHFNEPELLLWFCQQNGAIHESFKYDIEKYYLNPSENNQSITSDSRYPLMKNLWELVLAKRIRATHYTDLFDNVLDKIKNEGLTPTLRMELKKSLEPCVVLSEAWNLYPEAANAQESSHEIKRMNQLVRAEIELQDKDLHRDYESFIEHLTENGQVAERWNIFLPAMLLDFTVLLQDVFKLYEILEKANEKSDSSYWCRPSISKHAQNNNYQSWTILIDLICEAWIATAKVDQRKALYSAEEWLSIPYPIFKRLAFFAAAQDKIIPQEQAVAWLLADSCWWLWSFETKREVCRLLVSLAPRLTAAEQEKLEQAILLGPPRNMFKADLKDEEWEDTTKSFIRLRLEKLQVGGMALKTSKQKFQELIEPYPEWKLDSSNRNEFPVWSSGVSWREQQIILPRTTPELTNWLKDHQNDDEWTTTDWSKLCRDNMRIALRALCILAEENIWATKYWNLAFDAWGEEKLSTTSWRHIMYLLKSFPKSVTNINDDFISSIRHSFSSWLAVVAKNLDKQYEDIFFTLCNRILNIAYPNEDSNTSYDPVTEAINHPIGTTTEALLTYWEHTTPTSNQRIKEPFKDIFTKLCDPNITKFRYGRVLLVRRAARLFYVDQAWAQENLIPLFEWNKEATEAKATWQTFLAYGSAYPPFIAAIKTEFLETTNHYDKLGTSKNHYAYFLTLVGLKHEDMFTNKEIVILKKAFNQLLSEGLVKSIELLQDFLKVADDKEKYWKNSLQPFIHKYLPKDKEKVDADVVSQIALFCVEADKAFPYVFEELQYWLRPIESGSVMYKILKSEPKLCSLFPEQALSFLDKIINDNSYRYVKPLDLKKCLDAIKQAQPELSSDQRFKNLGSFVVQEIHL